MNTSLQKSDGELQHVQVSERYWKQGRRDYNNWPQALIRELFQNSIDAGATEIMVGVKRGDNDATELSFAELLYRAKIEGPVSLPSTKTCQLNWVDNGKGMDRKTLETKLLCLGESGKEFKDGNIGGFGIAKTLILFSQISYTVRTQDLLLRGKGGTYTITQCSDFVKGAQFEIMCDCNALRLIEYTRNWCRLSYVPQLTVLMTDERDRPEVLHADLLAPKESKRTWAWGRGWGEDRITGQMIVRLRGQMMHTLTLKDGNDSFVIELESSEHLQANRDGLCGEAAKQLNAMYLLATMSPREMRDFSVAHAQVIHGAKGPIVLKTDESSIKHDQDACITDLDQWLQKKTGGVKNMNRTEILEALASGEGVMEIKKGLLSGHTMALFNYTVAFIPEECYPDTISMRVRTALAQWEHLAIECGKILKETNPFCAGLIFSSSAAAQHAKLSTGVHAISCNLFKVEEGSFVWEGMPLPLMIAAVVHELTHIHEAYHYDNWSMLYTYNMAKVLPHTARLIDEAELVAHVLTLPDAVPYYDSNGVADLGLNEEEEELNS